jgi:hypothetical protein
MQDQIALLALGGLVLLTLGLVVVLWVGRTRVRRELHRARAEASALRAQVEEIERRLAEAARAADRAPDRDVPQESAGYVITHVGEDEPSGATPEPPQTDRALFADLVLRESVVKAAGVAHGLRRALSPEVRNRIRFEMRREVKRSRKQRRADLREARREWEARQRAAMGDSEDAA